MVREVKLSYENGFVEEGSQYKTFHIEGKLFLEQLKIEAMLRGAKFIQKKFDSIQDVLSLKETAIFNCTNESSSYLFDDNAFKEQHFLIF